MSKKPKKNKITQPRISIITPVLNGVNFLENNILSVKNQSYSNIEHIIVDGGSSDGTLDIIKKYEETYCMRWVSEKDKGVAEAMNKGFKMAKGKIFAWLDADNHYNSGVIKKVVEIFLQESEIGIVYGNVQIFDNSHDHLHIPIHPTDLNKALLKGCSAIPPQPGAFFRKKIYKTSGGFDTKYRVAADYDFWLKVLQNKPKIRYIPVCIGNFLIQQKGLSSNFFGAIKGVTETLIIGRKYNQPLKGKLYLFRSYLWIIKGFIINFITFRK